MKFSCEYCRGVIDAEKDKECPKCGASYEKNKEYLRLEKERKEKFDKSTKNDQKIAKLIIGIVVGIIVFSFVIMLANILTMNSRTKRSSDRYDEIYDKIINDTSLDNVTNTTNKEGEKSVTVEINEYGKTSKYQAMVTGYEQTSLWYKTPAEGYELVVFHLQVENLTDKEISKEDVNCIVDGVAQTNEKFSGYSTIPYDIGSKLTVKGDATFEVPKDATSYDIRYGDYITIHIEK